MNNKQADDPVEKWSKVTCTSQTSKSRRPLKILKATQPNALSEK